MSAPLRLPLERARRLSVLGQRLSSPRPGSILETVHELGSVQMDPTSAVARTEHLVLWSRLGRRYRPAELERLLWEERSLFEYEAYIVPTVDLWVHRESMRRFAHPKGTGRPYSRTWLNANRSFRRYVLSELRRRGPLRTRDLEDRTAEGWRTGGWNDDGRFTGMMLEVLWSRGEVMIVGRDGQQRLWDLAERRLPLDQPRRPTREVAREILDRQLRWRGVATVKQFGRAFDGRPPGWERALAELVREGVAVPAAIDGLAGEWFAHAEMLERPFRPRTVLLSPFDKLINDRQRTDSLFGFRYRIEIYVPKAKREYGYFVLPILHGDRLIGRLDPRFDRAERTLHVNGVWAEEDAPASAGPAVSRAIGELASWLGAREVRFGRRVPSAWRTALRDT